MTDVQADASAHLENIARPPSRAVNALPLRRLPITVPLFPAETVRSYIRRIAVANYLDCVMLGRHLHEPGAPGASPGLDGLALTRGGHCPR